MENAIVLLDILVLSVNGVPVHQTHASMVIVSTWSQ